MPIEVQYTTYQPSIVAQSDARWTGVQEVAGSIPD